MKDKFALKIQTDKLEKAEIFQNDTCLFEPANEATCEGLYAVETTTSDSTGALALARAVCGEKGLQFRSLDSGQVITAAQIVGRMVGKLRITPVK